ncbi:hypothetical protein Glove_13g134 [Diversispora epigaea]|uniref:Uncharacterized protein n=1 Tax=Diversispora epigaea TaxID=1348612 RepID=A0A397JQ65_9GLOM|nr:hypothetical protein Glove_13g134 [Diversispora epigaea]
MLQMFQVNRNNNIINSIVTSDNINTTTTTKRKRGRKTKTIIGSPITIIAMRNVIFTIVQIVDLKNSCLENRFSTRSFTLEYLRFVIKSKKLSNTNCIGSDD